MRLDVIGYYCCERLADIHCQVDGSQQDTAASVEDDTLDGCIWLTEEQIDAMMVHLNNKTTETDVHSRQKRTLVDFRRWPSNKWSMPITYKFDGTHCKYRPSPDACCYVSFHFWKTFSHFFLNRWHSRQFHSVYSLKSVHVHGVVTSRFGCNKLI